MELIIVAVVVAIILAICFLATKAKNAKTQETSASGFSKSTVDTLKNAKTDADKLLALDLGSEFAGEITAKLQADKSQTLEDILVNILDVSPKNKVTDSLQSIMFVGVNGVGKTTTLGKITYILAKSGKSVVIAAADTFRAAAADQLKVWAKRADTDTKGSVEIVCADKDGADPASVAFDGARVAVQNSADFLLIDTAGRQQSNQNLMQELAKIKRSIEKNTPVTDTYLVIDGTAGQTAVQQAKTFHDIAKLTGVVVTKLDGSAKGGVLLKVVHELNLPVKFIGTGEGLDDITEFSAPEYVRSLL